MSKNLKELKIGVFCGGYSSERGVSIKSAQSVYQVIESMGLDVQIETITEDKIKIYQEVVEKVLENKYDIVVPMFHGEFGEDGGIQSILDTLEIKYTGSGVLSSSLGLDKSFLYQMLEKYDIDIPKTMVLENPFIDSKITEIQKTLELPLIAKPNSGGSSIGITKIDSWQDLTKAVETAFEYSDKVVIQEFVSGSEYTCPVIGENILPIGEIKTNTESFFDYEAKYNSEQTEEIFPAKLPEDISAKIQKWSQQIHQLLGCKGISRSDFIYNPDTKRLVFLEINTTPGMTDQSLVPKSAKAFGWSYEELVQKILDSAFEK